MHTAHGRTRGAFTLAGLSGLLACSAGAPPGESTTVSAQSLAMVPGTSVFGAGGLIEYIPGTLPLVFSAGHGGTLAPIEIPARTEEACGAPIATARDLNTQELARDILSAFVSRTGQHPHVIINRLARTRLDANRPIDDGACGNPVAAQAWAEYHAFIEEAKASVVATQGTGWYTDLHGHGHTVQRLELGFNVSGPALRGSDADLDADPALAERSSIRTLARPPSVPLSAILRGPLALGTLLQDLGFSSVPSQQDPAPMPEDPFFDGGYGVERHGCSAGGPICGVQIEANLAGVRDTTASRGSFAMALVDAYRVYLGAHLGAQLPVAAPPSDGDARVVDNDNAANDQAWGRFAASSNWSNGTNSQQFGTGFRLAQASASATNDGAEFFFFIGVPGNYEIAAWWPALASRSAAASFRVFELDGGVMLADLRLNQQIDGQRWNPLGTFRFGKVGWAKVLISRSLSGPGSLAADAIRITFRNQSPVPQISAPSIADEGSPVLFDGTASSDPDGDALTFAWSFGDGTTATGATVSHTFVGDGAYLVTLVTTDIYGATQSASHAITVGNVAPTVSPLPAATLFVGERYAARATFSDPGADVWTATVDRGDGSAVASLPIDGFAVTIDHIYARAGAFTLTLTVHDGTDAGSSSVPVVVRTAADGIGTLIADVAALDAAGGLDRANATSLLAKLRAAARAADRGRGGGVQGPIGAFVHQLEALVRSGRVHEADAAPLLELAARISRSLACEASG